MADTSLRVFISYARSDGSAFAEELMAGLEAAGFDPFLDRHDIGGGEDWEARLVNLLQQADTVVYVLTPASVRSERCAWEIKQAETLSKRVIPVVAIDVPEADTPEPLRRLNYVFFSKGHSYGASLRELASALRTDLAWVREHTRLADDALRWHQRDRPEDLLLRGTDLKAAQAWLKAWKPGAPEPTQFHRDYINESDAAEQLRTSAEQARLAERQATLNELGRRTKIAGGLAILLLIVAAAAGVYLWRQQAQLDALTDELHEAQLQLEAKTQDVENAATSLRAILPTAQANAAGRPAPPTAPRPLPAPAPSSGGRSGAAGGAPPPSAITAAPEPTYVPPVATPDGAQTPAQSAVQAAVRQAYVDLGWDIDVFWCESGGEPNRTRAQSLVNLLTAERGRQVERGGPIPNSLAFPVGRVRLRALTPAVNARDGYRVSTDEVRAEQGEERQSAALRAFAAASGQLTLGEQRSGTKTVYYLSVFMCSAK
ncbi:MAG: TIR domain-containing protein [Vicinamibacterales bacterium]